MFGFITLLVCIAAWNIGGWWWLAAVIITLGYIGSKQESAKTVKPNEELTPQYFIPSPELSKLANTNESANPTNDWVNQLTEICARYSTTNFYVAELIPRLKHANAMEMYPVPDGGRMVALIDTTVLGSAKDGLAIGEYGISWHNDLTTESRQTSLRWSEFANISIDKDGKRDVMIGEGNKFNTSGSVFSRDKIISLLKSLQELYKSNASIKFDTSQQFPTLLKSAKPKKTVKSPGTSPAKEQPVVIDINTANYDSLLSLPSVGAAEARMILNKQASGTFFMSLDELGDFLQLKPHKVEQLRSLVTFSKRTEAPTSITSNSSPRPNRPIIKQNVSSLSPSSSESKPGSGRMID